MLGWLGGWHLSNGATFMRIWDLGVAMRTDWLCRFARAAQAMAAGRCSNGILGVVASKACERFAEVGCAQSCFVVPSCNGRPWRMIEVKALNLEIRRS